ncbi:DUF3667 domain-containing protein [Chryseosolibacter indicus]|uniref:DUF3667 domain-containing protein n=1 Tax=Chryseosolibacter indicus TaxID=2782351 RepID=A0ABS5VLL8_9BACT|nr:DUF3667 domain-containing protein [Chryseosolibacter indicus]MBT1701720.1 DUF3667 domain-containing protein [Chryseosolibacter indicus]
MDNLIELTDLQEHCCKSCSNIFTGAYCNECGEKVLEPKDKSFRSFLNNIALTLTFSDNKFIKSLWHVISNPGFLSREFIEGRRVNYLKPLQLFFVLNLIYFLFPLLQLFNTSLKTQMYLRTHSAWVRKLVNEKILAEGYTYQGYSLMYNDKTTSLAKLLIIVFVVLASLPFNVIYRKKNKYFTDHITLAVELATFNLAMNAIFLSLVLIVINKLIHWTHLGWEKYLDDRTLTIIFILTNVYFLFGAGRTFYGQTGFKLIFKVVLGLLGLFLALEAYRMILFLFTYWSL